jgi:hypothetical protein
VPSKKNTTATKEKQIRNKMMSWSKEKVVQLE